MSIDTETDTDVTPCRACRSPVFDDEQYCEACGTRVAASETTEERAAVPRPAAHRDEQDLGDIAFVSDVGHRRNRNEDAAAVAVADGRFVAVVCDGVATTANGDQAARSAADAALGVLQPLLVAPSWPDEGGLQEVLGRAFAAAQRAVMQVDAGEPGGKELSPSTTMVAAIVTPQCIVVGNVGDSRAYWLSSGPAESQVLTVDDSWAQERIAEGAPPDEAYADPDAHIITRWIGGDADSVVPRVTELEVKGPGYLLVCSDGLWHYFDDPVRLADLVPPGAPTPMQIARELTDAALDAGGQDNITAAVVTLRGSPNPTRPEQE